MKKKRTWKFAFAVTAAVAVAVAMFGLVGYSSICTRCGVEEKTVGWQSPMIPVTLAKVWWSSETPVSSMLKKTGLVAEHKHDRCFIHGGGNGAGCILGSGGPVKWNARQQGMVVLLEECLRLGDRELAERVVKVMFDPATAGVARMVTAGVPEKGFADAAAFAVWKEKTLERLKELALLKEDRTRL